MATVVGIISRYGLTIVETKLALYNFHFKSHLEQFYMSNKMVIEMAVLCLYQGI